MPELPEVETIRRQLAPLVEGRSLRRVEVVDPRWSHPLAPAELADALTGRRVRSLGRRGKYLVWNLSGDLHLAQHLRMTGTILCDPDPEPGHVGVRIWLGPARRDAAGAGRTAGAPLRTAGAGHRPGARGAGSGLAGDGSAEHPAASRLVVVDPRRFGTGQLLLGSRALDEFFAERLGLEPLDEGFTVEHLRALARGRTAPVKAFVLDQRRMAGVGNIYADEALHRADIHPLRPAGELTAVQCERLREALIWALEAGIEARGATIDDFRHVDGVWGSFQDRFRVHRRAGQPCLSCGTLIEKILVAGRGTYVCARCQPLERPQSPLKQPARPGGHSPRRSVSRQSRRGAPRR